MKKIYVRWVLALVIVVGIGTAAVLVQQQDGGSRQEKQGTTTVKSSQSKSNVLTLSEAESLIEKVGGEWPSDSQKILSQSADTTLVGGGAGAKGYDKITYRIDGQQVHIHEEFGTLDGGKYSVLGYMPAKDYTVER